MPGAPAQASEMAEALLEVARKFAIASQAVPAPPLVVPPVLPAVVPAVVPAEVELVLAVLAVPPVPAVTELAEPAELATAFPVDVPSVTRPLVLHAIAHRNAVRPKTPRKRVLGFMA